MRIGICGPAGSGKSTLAGLLLTQLHNEDVAQVPLGEGLGAVILPLAGPLKDIARQMGWDGQKDERGRRLLQLLGTECGRQCIDPDIWVKRWRKIASGWRIVIADDLRYDNEANEFDFIVHVGGRAEPPRWRRWLSRIPIIGRTFLHASESGISPYLVHYWFDNSGPIDMMPFLARRLIDQIFAEYSARNAELAKKYMHLA